MACCYRYTPAMPYPRKYSESKTINCSHEVVFKVIKDVSKYKEFVPWCINSRIIPKMESSTGESCEVFFAELSAGFLRFKDSYISKVRVFGQERIEAEALDSGLFNHLKSIWKITPNPDGTTTIDFFVDFEFNSYIYAYVANVFFLEVSKGMLTSFEKRCLKLSETL